MKRFVLLFSAVFAVGTLCAQQSSSRLNELQTVVERSQKSVDSLNNLIAQSREHYATKPQSRAQIAEQLTAMEVEALALKKQYDVALAAFTEYQSQAFVAGVDGGEESNLQQKVAEDTASVSVAYPLRANIVENGLFAASMTAPDYKMLRDAQRNESVVVTKIKEYLRSYDKMVSLQLEYERVDTEVAADSVLCLLDSVKGKVAIVEDAISDMWQAIYDNKVYAYNLLLEKYSEMTMLTTEEEKLSKAQIESDMAAGNYESDVVSGYYFRKLALLGFENRIAATFELTTARDSLARVAKMMKKDEYCLPRVEIVRRSFIEHEPLKVVKPTLYTTKNPIPHTRIYEYGTVYRIRIGIFTNRPNLSALKGITPLSYTDKYHGGKYAYFVGGFRTEEEALEGVQYLKKLGFKAPQPVMWVDGEYVSNIEEWKRKNIGFNIEITGVTTLSDAVKTHISIRNEKCQFSRVGAAFLVGTFLSQSDAELVASEIIAMDSKIKATVKSVKQ